ncbi:MAG TPA: N-acetylmuramidase domain-containing protein [Burkholderiales bacterium]
MFEGKGKPLSDSGLARAGETLGVELPALWAVMTVETKGCGFLPDRRPLILFERHWFRKLTGAKFDQVAPDLSNRTWGGYGKSGAYQHERLKRAIQLDRTAALESTSWGLGQVMGFNAKAVGFPDVEEMVKAMCDSEDAQFQGMVGFIASKSLARHLKSGDWAAFARAYNGDEFQKNQYDTKLARTHARYAVGPLPDLRVRAAQMYLNFLGFDTGGVDGWFGEKSHRAVMKFQAGKGMAATGALDGETLAALEVAAIG